MKENDANDQDERIVGAYATKEVVYRFRGADLTLSLSHGLFSSADVDAGTRLLLKVFSRVLDAAVAAGTALPRRILDAGSGTGVVGIAAARALAGAGSGAAELSVRAQDRDELARAFSRVNAARNGLGGDVYAAAAEPLLASPPAGGWELILSNVPAKAGETVLADFFRRSARLLAPGGRALVVVVEPLSEATRGWLAAAGAEWLREEGTRDHVVYSYGPVGAAETEAADVDAEVSGPDPYARASGRFDWEGTAFRIDAVHGVEDYDEPGRAYVLAAKLLRKLGPAAFPFPDLTAARSLLIHETAQGHFAAFLAASFRRAGRAPDRLVLCGRNILALGSSQANALRALSTPESTKIETAPAVDLAFRSGGAADGTFALVASFPETVPRVDRNADSWKTAAGLLAPGGLLVVSAPSAEAGRFDKEKPGTFSRAGELKRDGWRALAYRRTDRPA